MVHGAWCEGKNPETQVPLETGEDLKPHTVLDLFPPLEPESMLLVPLLPRSCPEAKICA